MASRFTSGLVLGAGISGGYASIGGTLGQRAGIPVGLGVVLAILLPQERDLAAGVVLGGLGVTAAVSRYQGRPALEFVPPSIRDAIERAPARLRSAPGK